MNRYLCQIIILVAVSSLACSPAPKAQETQATEETPIKQTDDPNQQTPEQIKVNIEQKHPATYYILASKLFANGQKEDAVFWFYLGQLRYRFHLAVNRDLDPSGDPALFASLSETIGRPINEYAFGDIPQFAKTIDKVLQWDSEHENAFTAKDGNQEQYESVRQGLMGLRESVIASEADIKQQRQKNGLENR